MAESSGRHHHIEIHETAKATASVDAKVKRGEQSWQILLVFLGFALTIEGTVISMLDLQSWARLSIFAVVAGSTWAAFMNSGWFQNRLLGWYQRNASRFR